MCDATNLLYHRTLSAPDQRCVCRPQGGAKGRGSRRMFWELAPRDVIAKLVVLQCCARMETQEAQDRKASRRTWAEYEHSPSNAIERKHTERILGNIRGRRTLQSRCDVQACKYPIQSSVLLCNDIEDEWDPNLLRACGSTLKKL